MAQCVTRTDIIFVLPCPNDMNFVFWLNSYCVYARNRSHKNSTNRCTGRINPLVPSVSGLLISLLPVVGRVIFVTLKILYYQKNSNSFGMLPCVTLGVFSILLPKGQIYLSFSLSELHKVCLKPTYVS